MICCKKTLQSFFGISFVLCLIITPQTVNAQAICDDQLAQSETLFYDGYFEAALVQVDNCLADNTITNDTKLKALILKAYIYEASAGEDFLLLQATVDAILAIDPDYSPDTEEVSRAFIQLVNDKKQRLLNAQIARNNVTPDSLSHWDLGLSTTADSSQLHLFWQPEPNGIPVVYFLHAGPAGDSLHLIDSLTISTITLPLPKIKSTTFYQITASSQNQIGTAFSATISFYRPAPIVAFNQPPPKRSWIKWVGIGSGIIAAGATTAWLLTRDDGSGTTTLEGPPALPNLVGDNQ